jgi:peptidoglycan hydrolase CwlO-like protein
MGLKRKQILAGQKAHSEKMLEDRLALMAGKGVKTPKTTDKDPIVRKLKAQVKAADRRLRAITDCEKRGEDAAKAKAAAIAAKAAPKEEKPAAKAEKPKKAAQEGKEKKPKGEKKAGAPKPPAGDEAPKPPKAPEGGTPA